MQRLISHFIMLREMFLTVLVTVLVCVSARSDINTQSDIPVPPDASTLNFPDTVPVANGVTPTASVQGNFSKQAVSADSGICSGIGNDVLLQGGNAVDAAIASLLCSSVVHPHESGLGGNAVLTIYIRDTQTAVSIVGHGPAPGAASQDMFASTNGLATSWNSITVPGFLSGIYEAHRQFGITKWSDLFQPAIDLARNGVTVDASLAAAIADNIDSIRADPGLRSVFIKADGNPAYAGDVIVMSQLANTLEAIAGDACGTCEFYRNSIANSLVSEIAAGGGILTKDDFFRWRATTESPVQTTLFGNTSCFTSSLPSSGIIKSNLLNHPYRFYREETVIGPGVPGILPHREGEVQRTGLARFYEIGDPVFNPDMEGFVAYLTAPFTTQLALATINNQRAYNGTNIFGMETNQNLATTLVGDEFGTAVSVLDCFGNAVAASSSLRSKFGSKRLSPSTGVILNDYMGAFETDLDQSRWGRPLNPKNFIAPYKRPITTAAPSIILDLNRDVEFVLAESGGQRALGTAFQVVLYTKFAGMQPKKASDFPRVFGSIYPQVDEYEANFPVEWARYMAGAGNKLVRNDNQGFIQLIKVQNKRVLASSDGRKPGGGVVAGL